MKEGWGKYNLMDICNVTTGKHDANHAEVNGKYRFYTCSSQYLYCNTKRYEGECIILPGNGVNVGESYYFNGEFDAYQRTYVIDKIDKRIIPMFLYYHLQNNWKSEGVAKQYGSATNYIKIGNFKDYIVKTPQSLSEQQSIVDYLDSAFAKIDAMKANAEKALNEAKALFQASLKEMLEPKEGWEEKKLKETAKYRRGSFPQPYGNKEWYDGEGSMPFVQVAELQEDSFNLVPITKRLISKIAQPLSVFVPAGTVLVTLQGSIGKVAITDYDSYVDRTIAIFQDYKIAVDKTFFAYQLKIRFEIERLKARGTTIKTITKEEFANFIINCPPLSEQQSIVATLDSLKSKVDRLQANYDKISQECDALKQAILRQVFE